MDIGTKVAEADEGFGAGVFDFDAACGGFVGDEDFIFGGGAEANHGGGLEGKFSDPAFALHGDPAAGTWVAESAFGTGFYGEFFGGEKLLAVDGAVNDPAIGVTGAAALGIDDGFDVVAVFEVRIDVFIPIELSDDEIEILVFLGGHIFDKEGPGYVASFDDRLEHAEDVATPLGFVGAEGARGVQDAGWDQPTGTAFESVGAGQVENTIVAAVPIFEAASEVIAGCAGFESHKGIAEVVVDVVVLGREVVAFGFPFLSDEGRIFLGLVHVMGDRPHVIEELRVDGPALVLGEDRFTDKTITAFGYGIPEKELGAFEGAEAESFVPDAAFVGGFGGAGEPTFIDTTPIGPEGIKIIGMEFDAAAGMEEAAWNPRGC